MWCAYTHTHIHKHTHTHTEYYSVIKKEWNVAICCNMDGLGGHYAKSPQSCPTLCDPRDGSPPGPAVPGILQVRTLEWVATFFSNASKWKVKVKCLSHVQLLATPWTAAYQAPPSMGFSRQEYWSGVPTRESLFRAVKIQRSQKKKKAQAHLLESSI